jgi:hypothetical protein
MSVGVMEDYKIRDLIIFFFVRKRANWMAISIRLKAQQYWMANKA